MVNVILKHFLLELTNMRYIKTLHFMNVDTIYGVLWLTIKLLLLSIRKFKCDSNLMHSGRRIQSLLVERSVPLYVPQNEHVLIYSNTCSRGDVSI